ncbi:MAG: BlaI/MecI/CopY family transcriptional regulator [Maricaulis sp.]|nr:BlaI/MecI/CopY family transcriptional regulator [Maricaulis sp.]MDG2045545.1 BlaI/MecI/CopY family transcriptional regulator [Maricaulis sp.]
MASATHLTEEENRAMRVLWDRGAASATELAMAMSGHDRMAHSTALELLRRLREKGAVERHRSGGHITYRPQLNRETAKSHTLGRILGNIADGSGQGLGMVVLRDSDFDPQDLADLRAEREEKAAAKKRRDLGH